jgi:hypothetical protein
MLAIHSTQHTHVNSLLSDVNHYYRFSGITRYQTADVLNISNKTPFLLTVTKSFTPGILLRKYKNIMSGEKIYLIGNLYMVFNQLVSFLTTSTIYMPKLYHRS